MNKDFLPFKHRHKGEAAALFASGPSLSKFDPSVISEKEVVNIGVNSVIHSEYINLDYYFTAHNSEKDSSVAGGHPNNLKYPNYLKTALEKGIKTTFCGTLLVDAVPAANAELFTKEEARESGAISFAMSQSIGFHSHIDEAPLYNHSIVFAAMAFILYAGFSKIYLIGQDCSGGYSFLFPNLPSLYDQGDDPLLGHWENVKNYISIHYSDAKVVSINPMSLKGLFADV